MKKLKKTVKQIMFKLGYKLSKINNNPLLNPNQFIAAKNVIKSKNPIVFDIGMNHGQTLKDIKASIPNSIIYGFEPSKYCFKQIERGFKADKNIILNNLAIGDIEGVLEFNEYSWDAMNSFLVRAYGKAKIIEKYNVNITTIDKYCQANNISKIHILKSDTEGFELKVLKGAESMMNKNKIQFIYIELFFNLNYIGQSSVGDIFSYLESKNFSLVQFYEFNSTGKGLASKSDALFVNDEF